MHISFWTSLQIHQGLHHNLWQTIMCSSTGVSTYSGKRKNPHDLELKKRNGIFWEKRCLNCVIPGVEQEKCHGCALLIASTKLFGLRLILYYIIHPSMHLCSVASDFVTPWTVAHQACCLWNFPGNNTGWVAISSSRVPS